MTQRETVKRLFIALPIAWVAMIPLVSLGAKYTPNVISKDLPLSLSAMWASLSVGQIAGLLFCARKNWFLPTAGVALLGSAVATVISGVVVNLIFGLYGWGSIFAREIAISGVLGGVSGAIVGVLHGKFYGRREN